MNQAEIIKLMREACDKDKVDAWANGFWTITQDELERFFRIAYAAGVAAGSDKQKAQRDELLALVKGALGDYSTGYVLGTDWVERAERALVS